MKHNYLIGLGGSGGKVIANLYKRLLEEHGETFGDDVECIAIDTDQDELGELAQLGVKKICLSGNGNVGQYFNNLGDDVTEWCPNTANEGNFFSSSLFNGASQCRLKSRLCFSNFLKDKNNALEAMLEESLLVSATGEASMAEKDTPKVLITSSIAGGTGSGIFIQVALYIKQFFRKNGIEDVIVHGLFACPDLYKRVVPSQQLSNLYSNAYAVIRELNAFNLICGSDTTSAYGGDLDIDIEISTSCEGRLFEKDQEGRYGDKPYDLMYFIDKVNSLSRIRGGLTEYYKAMADIAYSHLYADFSGEVMSNESNELRAHNIAPSAIYGSAGASSIRYPYDDIVDYFANRAIYESFGGAVWTDIDVFWKNYLREKDAVAKASGLSKYTPAPDERGKEFIKEFNKRIDSSGISKNEFSFLEPMVKVGEQNKVNKLFALIEKTAENFVLSDDRIVKEREKKIGNVSEIRTSLTNKVMNPPDDSSKQFAKIADIDANLDSFCKNCIEYLVDESISFSNSILCDSPDMWDTYDKKDCSLVKALLINEDTGEWVHPTAARYLLYSFMNILNLKIDSLIDGVDTVADDADDFYNSMVSQIVEPQRRVLSTSEENRKPNAKVLEGMAKRIFGKKATLGGVDDYMTSLDTKLQSADETFKDVLLYFSYIKVADRLERLIDEYELFFDNLDEFIKKAQAATTASEQMHDNSKGDVYVCASAEVKNSMYDAIGDRIDVKTGKTASAINHSLFGVMREKAFATKKAGASKAVSKNMEGFFATVSDLVSESIKDDTAINGVLDRNVFQAMLYEYQLTNSESAGDEGVYAKDNAAKERIDQFVALKLMTLSKMAAPSLVFDVNDTYHGMFRKDTDGEHVEKTAVSNAYRYISHNADVDESIRALIGASSGDGGAVSGYYRNYSSRLPKDSEEQTINFNYVRSDKVDKYSILCYSTVHCLQPYQIKAFDELHGGVYYEYYAKQIDTMEKLQKYSMTPHLDKRWHKHGVMPYINVAKEVESRYDLAKAFLYALCVGKIGYDVDGSDVKLTYADPMLSKSAEVIFYKGRSVPYYKLNRAMYWFADKESLIGLYAARFDDLIEAEIERLSKYGDTIKGYKLGINNYANILRQFNRNILRPLPLRESADGKTKKTAKKESVCILEFAWQLHLSEENEVDKDYGELLIEVLCDIIRKYSKAPYNAKQIESRNEQSEAYVNYLEICMYTAGLFLDKYAEFIKEDISTKRSREEELRQLEEANGEAAMDENMTDDIQHMVDEVAEKKNTFGRSDEDITDNQVVVETGAIKHNAAGNVANEKRFVWANAEMNKHLMD